MLGIDPVIVLFGVGVGILIGLTGIGGGSLMTPLLIIVLGVQPVVAVGTDLAYGAMYAIHGMQWIAHARAAGARVFELDEPAVAVAGAPHGNEPHHRENDSEGSHVNRPFPGSRMETVCFATGGRCMKKHCSAARQRRSRSCDAPSVSVVSARGATGRCGARTAPP